MKTPAGNSVSNGCGSGYIQNPSDALAANIYDIENVNKILMEQQLVADNANKLVKKSRERLMWLLEKQMSIVKSYHSSFITGSSNDTMRVGVRSAKDRLGSSRVVTESDNVLMIQNAEHASIEMNSTEISNKKIDCIFQGQAHELSFGAKHKDGKSPPGVSGVWEVLSARAQKNTGISLVPVEDNNPTKIVKSNGDHELEQNAGDSTRKTEKEPSLQVNPNTELMTLSGGADHENVMNDNGSRKEYPGKLVEVSQNDGFYAGKASINEKETYNTSPETAVTTVKYNLEQNADEPKEKTRKGNELDSQNTQNIQYLGKESMNLPVHLMKISENAYVSIARHNDFPLQEISSCNISGIKRKAESPPPGAGSSKIVKTFSCELCHVVVQSQQTLTMHMEGKKHKKAERKAQELKHNGVVSDDRKLAMITGTSSIRNLEQNPGDDSISMETNPGVTIDRNAVQVAQRINNAVEGNMILKTGDGDVDFVSEACKVSATTEEAVNAHKKEMEYLDKLLEVAKCGETQVENITETRREREFP